ncbi:receptor-like protein 12 isoform X1 [Carex littledalei]|uniref:Receptor-like protein 12 isoform X1 n=1 Tax=Carex littledalei TaxID=544730 RepID=A0A833QP39_9POAL|nr:receptor-like protein 12 isoform X1 [Carex littledalei]
MSNTNPLYLHDTGLKTLLSNLTKLQVLRLDGVDISLNGSEWGNAVFQVGPTLQELSMANCGLRGNLPDEIFHLTNLTELDLSYNLMLSGQLPEFTKQSFLQYLYLAYTNFTGPLPDSIGNLQYLSVLDLSNCNFYGEIPPSITNLTRLEELDLGSNILTVPPCLLENTKLEALNLKSNKLSRPLPRNFSQACGLQEINLNGNVINGSLPKLLMHCNALEVLDLGNNQIKDHKLYLKDIRKVVSSPNPNTYIGRLGLNINSKSTRPKFIWSTLLGPTESLNASGNITDPNESRICDLWNQIAEMISGPVPLLPQGIDYVDFSSNYFFLLPAYFVSSSVYLSISNNSLTGEIPLSICNATLLDIRNVLLPNFSIPSLPQVLDLSYNNLTGTMPPCLLENAELEVLNLRSNKLSGPLSQNISQGCKFRTIDLSGNRINGSLPRSLMNCNTLEVLDLGNNQIVDRFPFWLGNLKNLRVLVLRSNQFYGTISSMDVKMKTNESFFPTLKVFDLSSNHLRGIIPKIVFEKLKAMATSDALSPLFHGQYGYEYNYQNSITVVWKGGEMEITNSLSIFNSLDLSQNGFSGEIPEVIGHLKSLDGLNLSHNALTGSIPSEFSKLQQLQSLDLSCNKLSGPIPQELTSLHFLSALNLSYNNLVGKIPQVPQLSTFSNASYLGNPGLCGSPLSMQCATTPSNDGFNKDLLSKSSTDIIGLSISIGLGLGVGFASVIWVLISWENGRAWFNFIVDRFYFRQIPWIVLHLRLAIGSDADT